MKVIETMTMFEGYVHGYRAEENERLSDQAGTLVELLHGDTGYPTGSSVLEVGCGVGAQTVALAERSPGAHITAIDVSRASLADAAHRYGHCLRIRIRPVVVVVTDDLGSGLARRRGMARPHRNARAT